MKKAFTPSMSQANISQLDGMRMRGDQGKITNPSNIERKQPWYVPTPVNKEDEIQGRYEPEVPLYDENPEQPESAEGSEEENEVTKSLKSLKNWLQRK